MSHKQAKRLRKMIGISAEQMRNKSYATIDKRPVMVDSGRVGVDGNAIMIPEARHTNECEGQRKIYQIIKREEKPWKRCM